MEDLRLQFDELKTQVTEMNQKLVAELDNKLDTILDSKLESKLGAYTDKILAALNHQNQLSRPPEKPPGENPNCSILGSGSKETVMNSGGNVGRDRVPEVITVGHTPTIPALDCSEKAETISLPGSKA
ncbi:OLC1v1008814C1 [Oldenlandia corymbosa var. corymbosa]|uniref:OLC1v1008814C1 n=1 Tax=Oldenlandia corymbosa var. corymbosa TaxID=529605 RepID=A0AAV1DPY5_OLDCO|nr:OLC1v1008814C1 [Oldenlandia corymbosa var. corymbosa]